MFHPANREAERLRVIIESLAYTDPDMPMSLAKEAIFEIEQKSLKLESAQLPMQQLVLENVLPETIAKFIDLQPDIQALVPHKKINAIKECRSRVASLGLKEAKEGVEHWAHTRTGAIPYVPSPMPTMTATTGPAIAAAIDAHLSLREYGREVGIGTPGYNKINWIKDVRAELRVGLKEAKDGCEQWLRDRGY